MPTKIVIVDFGMGNLWSVYRKLNRFKAIVKISSKAEEILDADKIIVPGVGHFKKAMENLITLNLKDVLHEAVLINQKPVLGICLGMQLMAKKSEEGLVEGLGWIDAEVVRFQITDTLNYKIPHMGWNQIQIMKQSPLMKQISDNSEFYFVHSYHFKLNNPHQALNQTIYSYPFVSAIEKEHIFGVQYHPEKSHETGELLLNNFINL